MKTAISLPDRVFEAAERTAKRLGVSRSELYATAVAEFIDRHKRARITEKLNEVYEDAQDVAGLDPGLHTLQSQSLEREEW